MELVNKSMAIFDRTAGSLAFLGGLLIVIIMLAVVIDIMMSYFLNRSALWLFEVIEYSLLYITFLGTAWLLRIDKHVKMDFVLNSLDSKNQLLLNIITSILGVITCLVLTWYGGKLTWYFYQTGYILISPIRPLKAPIFAVIPVGGFLLLIQFLRRTKNYFDIWRLS